MVPVNPGCPLDIQVEMPGQWLSYVRYVSFEEVGVDLGVIVSRMVFKAAQVEENERERRSPETN